MKIFHGATTIVTTPDVHHSRHNLDFGTGFYVTTNQEQATKWAQRKYMEAHSTGVTKQRAIVNVYDYDEQPDQLQILDLTNDLDEWLDFVCRCRSGAQDYQQYDLIKGKVADDKVYDVVYLYQNGIWDKNRALREMKVFPLYDQIMFVRQEVLQNYVRYVESFEV